MEKTYVLHKSIKLVRNIKYGMQMESLSEEGYFSLFCGGNASFGFLVKPLRVSVDHLGKLLNHLKKSYT